ncbi:MAG TPA: arginase family protein [Candidatus Limnocylindrales bacterium]|nr:arginase family protein [Candidatus Limnocylindrales bacterium]
MAARPLHLFEAGVVTEQRFVGLAAAPAALAEAFLPEHRAEKHIRVPFNPRERWLTAAREACRTLADGVESSLRAGALVGVLGGECTLVAGTISGALAVEPDITLVYIDAHADFNTLATTLTHYVSGMCLAHVCGRSVAPLLWPGARKITEEHVALVGGRALDPGERQTLERSRVLHVPFDSEHRDPARIIAYARRKKVWLHLDVDIIDSLQMSAVVFPSPRGAPASSIRDLITQLAAVADVRGFEVCGYDPRQDERHKLTSLISGLFSVFAPRAVAV